MERLGLHLCDTLRCEPAEQMTPMASSGGGLEEQHGVTVTTQNCE